MEWDGGVGDGLEGSAVGLWVISQLFLMIKGHVAPGSAVDNVCTPQANNRSKHLHGDLFQWHVPLWFTGYILVTGNPAHGSVF